LVAPVSTELLLEDVIDADPLTGGGIRDALMANAPQAEASAQPVEAPMHARAPAAGSTIQP
jgi:hypothetical protein